MFSVWNSTKVFKPEYYTKKATGNKVWIVGSTTMKKGRINNVRCIMKCKELKKCSLTSVWNLILWAIGHYLVPFTIFLLDNEPLNYREIELEICNCPMNWEYRHRMSPDTSPPISSQVLEYFIEKWEITQRCRDLNKLKYTVTGNKIVTPWKTMLILTYV